MPVKKSQMEIMGLAVVIVIAIIAITFFVVYSMSTKSSNIRTGFITAELSNNLVYTYLDTASESCKGNTMTQLMKDCVESNSIECDDGKNSCDYATSVAQEIFDKTIESWNYTYYFFAKVESNSPFMQIGNICPGSKVGKPYVLPTEAGSITVVLDICLRD